MAIVTIAVEDYGAPVPGALVYVGETVEKALVADGGGIVTKTVPDDFAIVAQISVEVGGLLRGSFGPVFLKAGQSRVFDIGRTGV